MDNNYASSSSALEIFFFDDAIVQSPISIPDPPSTSISLCCAMFVLCRNRKLKVAVFSDISTAEKPQQVQIRLDQFNLPKHAGTAGKTKPVLDQTNKVRTKIKISDQNTITSNGTRKARFYC